MIGAVMGRTSKEVDDAFSVSSQIDAGQEYAARNQITVPDTYLFREDFTGRVIDRPEMNKIRALVHERKIQALIIYAVDRLARRVSVGEILLDEFFQYGVQLHIVAWGSHVRDTPEDRLRFNFETTFSGFERDKILERTTRGKRKKASQGFIVGNNHPAYGYALNRTKDNFDLTEQAEIARDILIMFGIQHIRPAQIVTYLDEHDYPSPGLMEYRRLEALYDERRASGRLTEEEYEKKIASAKRFLGNGRWNLGSLYRLISQVDLYAGKYSFTVSGEPFTVSIPAIITEEEAEEVKKMRAVTRGRFERRRETKHEFLFARRLHCAHCGKSMVVSYNPEAYLYYRCPGNTKRGNYTCDQRPVTAKLVDGKGREFIKELLLNPRRLFAWWQEQQNATRHEREHIEQDIASLEAKVKTTTEKYHRTLDRLTDNLDADEMAYYIAQRDRLKSLLLEYREELNSLTSKRTTVHVDESVVTDFVQMGEEYREVLETSQDFTFWRGLVDDLDITAVVGYEDERRYVEFIVFKKVRRKFYPIENRSINVHQEELSETQTLKQSTATIVTPRSAMR